MRTHSYTFNLLFNYIFSFLSAILQDVGSNPLLKKHRDLQLTRRRELYRWKKFEDLRLPSGIDQLPLDEGFELVKNIHFYSSVVLKSVNTALAGLHIDLDHLHGYEEYAKLLREPEIRTYELSRWTSDVEFGRQVLNGVNPVMIHKCERLPAKFPVTDAMVQTSLHRGLTLVQEMEVSNGSYMYMYIHTRYYASRLQHCLLISFVSVCVIEKYNGV